MKPTYLFPLFLMLFFSCSHYTPKPSGYFRIETGEHAYQTYQHDHFSFNYSKKSDIEIVTEGKQKHEFWFNIVYPSLHAWIYCTYFPIQTKDFNGAAEDSRTFVYRHVVKADDIRTSYFENPEARVYSVLYEIGGDVASPIQFTLSDSTSYFLRGSVYFDCIPNQDSIAPSLDFIREDILELMQTFCFQRKS